MVNCIDCNKSIARAERCIKCSGIFKRKPIHTCAKCEKILSARKYKYCIEHKDYDDTAMKISKSLTGRKLSPEHAEKCRKVNLGRKASFEIRKKLSEAQKRIGNRPPYFKGENHPRWIKERTTVIEKHRIRGTIEWKNWRKSVFERDEYTCQECGIKGGYLEPHHIVPIRSDWDKLFELTNGITLCRPCHKETIWKESDFYEKYSQIVAAQR